MINHASNWGLPRRYIGGCWLHYKNHPWSFWFSEEQAAWRQAYETAMIDDTPAFIGRFTGKLSNASKV